MTPSASNRVVIGIDPGVNGGIAVLLGPGILLEYCQMPYRNSGSRHGGFDRSAIRNIFLKYSPTTKTLAEAGSLQSAMHWLASNGYEGEALESATSIVSTLQTSPWGQAEVYIEEQQPMRGGGKMDGTKASFKTGLGYGWLQGLLYAMQIPYNVVRPRDWQTVFGLTNSGLTGVALKRLHVGRAEELFPQINFSGHDGIADALLIARYGCSRGATT